MPGGEEEERESRKQLEARQEAEEEELNEKATAHLESIRAAGHKGKKAKTALEAAERDVEQWRYELAQRHQEEVEALEERGGGAAGVEAPPEEAPAEVAATAAKTSAVDEEAERALRKKEKALQKRQSKSKKAADREEDLEREKANAGPARRDLELASIAAQLAAQKPSMKVLEVLGDGHCLYRAVADQLRRARPDLHRWEKEAPDLHHEEVRGVCASALRRRRDDYEPFAELNDGEDFAGYCDRVQKSADWGGELELRALADELGARIVVHRAEEVEPLVLGGAKRGEALHVTYHRFWYALGEHYNSAVLRESEE